MAGDTSTGDQRTEELVPGPADPDKSDQDEKHLLVKFCAGDSFDPESIVTLRPSRLPDHALEGSEFLAKVVRYRAERSTLTLIPAGTGWQQANVLRSGTSIVCNGAHATIEETDAEWHRNQQWACPCPKGIIGEKVRWDVEVDGYIYGEEGTVWGWLPANESDYYPEKSKQEPGAAVQLAHEPVPLWRVKFRTDIGDDLDAQEIFADLEEYQIEEALKRQRHSGKMRHVSQWSVDGHFIQRHDSITAAFKSLEGCVKQSPGCKTSAQHLRHYINSGKPYGGYLWSDGEEPRQAVRSIGGHSVGRICASRDSKMMDTIGDRLPVGAPDRAPAESTSKDRSSETSFKCKHDQGWGDLLDAGVVIPGDIIRPPGRGANKGREAVVQRDGKLLEGHQRWDDPVAFCVKSNLWKKSSLLKHRNKISNCVRVKMDEEDDAGGIRLSDLKLRAKKHLQASSIRHQKHDKSVDKSAMPADKNLKPTVGSVVKVRCEVEEGDDEIVDWFDGKITGFNEFTKEWVIKLVDCDQASNCAGCDECKYLLSSDTLTW